MLLSYFPESCLAPKEGSGICFSAHRIEHFSRYSVGRTDNSSPAGTGMSISQGIADWEKNAMFFFKAIG